LLTVAVFQPLVGALCDVVDHQKLLLGSILLFSIGVLICCLSRHIADFLVGRSIQGIGGGGILVLVNIIPTAMVSLRHRPIAIMLNQFGFVLGTILGPVLGGIIGQYTTWRWIFYLNFPLCGVALPIVVSAMKHDGSVRHFDYIGAILFLASTCSLLIGIIWGGEQYPWNSWQTLLPILVGILGLMAALLWEVYGTSAPFLCLSLFSIRSASATYVSTFLQGFLVSDEFLMVIHCPLPGHQLTRLIAVLSTVLSSHLFRRGERSFLS
jgi:MFS family permease